MAAPFAGPRKVLSGQAGQAVHRPQKVNAPPRRVRAALPVGFPVTRRRDGGAPEEAGPRGAQPRRRSGNAVVVGAVSCEG
ncbi:hypothetical protein NDU88_007956 [Pleurodeles waltl]|uniref:Uncharacterized protein n=1 Tax=Pleurodeles waltl TaxID=8319 RepID=A0AAV7N4Y4_PLEWA|nr:hypothetical protein NDU88_007956 [Pleurodeles waltl]